MSTTNPEFWITNFLRFFLQFFLFKVLQVGFFWLNRQLIQGVHSKHVYFSNLFNSLIWLLVLLLCFRRRGSWLWHCSVITNTAIICVMGVSLNLTTPIKFSLTLINSDVHCILCKVYNRVDSSNITSQTWIFYFFRFYFDCYI